MARSRFTFTGKIAARLLVLASLVLVLAPLTAASADASLGSRSLMMSSSLAGASADYDVNMTLSDSASSIGSIEFLFCSNSALIVDTCDAPIGFDASSATLTSQAGATGFTISGLSDANKIIISRAAQVPGNKDLEYVFNNIVNPQNNGSYFARLLTFTSSDASGAPTNYGGLAFAITNAAKIQAEVPPFIIFCVGATIPSYNCSSASGDYINFGELVPSETATGSEQFLVATNATNGYNISVTGRTMTSGNNVIDALKSGGQSVAGTSQFGLNLVANSSPSIGQNPIGPGIGAVAANYGQSNHFRFNSGEFLATSSAPSDYRKYTVSYIVNRPPNQAPGVYATTMTFVALGNF